MLASPPDGAPSAARHLLVRRDALRPTRLVPPERLKDGAIASEVVYGTDCSLIVATREAGYHSIPHTHEAEQLNWVLRGSIWIFVEHDGFLAHEGDFFRIPSGAVHWSRVAPEAACTLVEAHAPGLVGDAWVRESASGLVAEGEQDAVRAVPTLWPRFDAWAEVEARVMNPSRA